MRLLLQALPALLHVLCVQRVLQRLLALQLANHASQVLLQQNQLHVFYGDRVYGDRSKIINLEDTSCWRHSNLGPSTDPA